MLTNPYAMPGMGTPYETSERAILWNSSHPVMETSEIIVSTTVDATNSTTTQLRPGLLLGKITASGKLGAYSATATDGRDVVYGVLGVHVNMLDPVSGTAGDRTGGKIYLMAPLVASKLLGLDYQARTQMRGRFLFDDSVAGAIGIPRTVAKTADYTVLAADNGTLFTNQAAAGAVVFTLPALADITVGWSASFFVETDQSVTVTAPSGKLVAFNNATRTSIAFSTSSEKIGARIDITVNADATKYLANVQLGAETQTPTFA